MRALLFHVVCRQGEPFKLFESRRFKRFAEPSIVLPASLTADDLIEIAQLLAQSRLREKEHFTSPELVGDYFTAAMRSLEQEVFVCLFLDNQHCKIAFETLFYGTIDGATVHPREVVKRALQLNAAAVIIGHNHPSGVSEPSQADRRITERLKQALELIDVRVLDHFVVGNAGYTSFTQRGIL